MENRTKLTISIIVAIVSLITMVFMINSQTMFQSALSYYGFFVLPLIFLVSIIAIITYSRTGWKLRGSKTEWIIAGLVIIGFIFLRIINIL
jgi:peptidoglycan/LPS O-acetylase OafA/YrhL